MPLIDLTALKHANTHTFLPERLYLFFTFLWNISVFLGKQNHISTSKIPRQLWKQGNEHWVHHHSKLADWKADYTIKTIALGRKQNVLCSKAKLTPSGKSPVKMQSQNKNWENPSPAPWLSLWIKIIVLVVARSQDIFNQCLSLVLVEGRKRSLRGHSCRRTSRQRRLYGCVPCQLGSDSQRLTPQARRYLLLLASFFNQLDWLLVFFATMQSEIQSEVS